MTYEELLRTTPAELYRRQMHNHRQQERRWEQTRLIVATIANGYTKKRIRPRDIIQLDLDTQRVGVEISQEEIEKTLKAWGLSKN